MSLSWKALFVAPAALGLVASAAYAQPTMPRQPQAQAQPQQQGGTDLDPVVGDGKIIVHPSMRVGQKMVANFREFPDPGDSDQLVVVAAGAPDNVTASSQGEKPLSYTYVTRYFLDNGWEVGPFAPGRYEIRWLTTLYNNEKKLEVGARAQFSVRR